MKTIVLNLAAAAMLTATMVGCNKAEDPITTDTSVFTDTQLENLHFMQEEEKLARDVYIALYDQWADHPYSNISYSEQTHMDAIQDVLDQYEITSLMHTDTAVFNNGALQALYDSLVAVGNTDQQLAIMIGAEIEEIDILDLENALANEFTEGVVYDTYNNLLSASKKHLAAYTKYMENHLDTFYTPRHMTQEVYEQYLAEGQH